ncbi:MAG: hypothetical protein ACTSUE_16455 [Promethearchaeota archaeon]
MHGSADRAVGVRRTIKTPGPMMGNVTVDVYQESREHHREISGGKYFPGPVDDMTMYLSEFELVFMFKDGSSRPAIGDGVTYGSHVGYPVFSVLNGINRDKFWLYNNLDLVGVTKSHTRLNDRGSGNITQTAAFRAGSCSIIHNGKEAIMANTEFKVVFYDKVNDPEDFFELFEARRKREAGRVRVRAVIEPYKKHEDIAMMLRYYHPHTSVGSADRPSGHHRATFGSHPSAGQFTVESIIEKIIKGASGTMLLGFLIGSFIQDEPRKLDKSAAQTRSLFKNYLSGQGRAQYQRLSDVLYSEGEDSRSGLGEFVAGMMFPQAEADMLKDLKEMVPRKSGLEVAVASQIDANYMYRALKELHSWERKWVVGLAQQTAHPNGVMDIIIRR